MSPRVDSLPTVLIVDDEPANLAALSALLKPHFRTRVAKSGLKAIERVEKAPPELVLLDVDMPELDGYETCRRIKRLPGCQDLPIIFVTGMRSESAETRGFEAGAVDYVHKPVSPSLLVARVQTHLSLQAAVQEARRHEAESNRLLDVLMPPNISQELRETGTVSPRLREGVAVLFADLVGFTQWCNQRSAVEVVDALQDVMTVLEDVARAHGVEKLKTIGDAFMGAAGLMEQDPSAAQRAVDCGRAMNRAIASMDNGWRLRVGVQVGPVVAGIIGRERFRFDIWGDTVNQASRLCDLSEAGAVCVDGALAERLNERAGARQTAQMKGVGAVEVLQLLGVEG